MGVSAFEDASARFAIPTPSGGSVMYSDLAFPFDPSTFETKVAGTRKHIEAEKHKQAF